jgi:hypothetical protein
MSNTEPKHTRGPWRTAYSRTQPGGISIEAPGSERNFIIARCPIDSFEDKANASLIAAAPDMLKALEDILYGNPKEAADKYEQGGCSDIWRNAITVVNKAKNIHQ